MKNRIAVILALLMLLSAVGCGEGTSKVRGSAGPDPVPAEDTPSLEEKEPAKKAAPSESFSQNSTIEETVLVDELNVKVTATGLSYTNSRVELTLLIENNSDKNLSFCSGTLGYSCNSVNGYMTDDGYMNADVAPGKKSFETVTFDLGELAVYGISEIADIEIGFDIHDDGYNDYLETGPRQLKTSAADAYDYSSDTYITSMKTGGLSSFFNYSLDYFGEDELYNQKGIRVISGAILTNKDGNKALFLEVENTTPEQFLVSVGDFCVNGLMIQDYTWTSDYVNAGKRRVMLLSLSSMLDENFWDVFGVTNIADVAFNFGLKDADGNDLRASQEIHFAVLGMTPSIDRSGDVVYSTDGITIISKGLVPDSSSYSDNIHALFLIENSSSVEFDADVDYGTLSINGFMTDFYCYGQKIPVGRSGALDVEITDDSLEDNRIGGISDISDLELTFEFRDDDYNRIAAPVVSVEYR